jgi:hypothetical protein
MGRFSACAGVRKQDSMGCIQRGGASAASGAFFDTQNGRGAACFFGKIPL